MILTNNGTPSQTLLQLLDLLNVQHDGTLESIVNATQHAWVKAIRPHDTERWQIEHKVKEKFAQCAHKAMPLLDHLGLCKAIESQKNHYEYVLILGSDLQDMCLRTHTLLKLIQNNCEFDHIIILVGERPLNPQENKENFITIFRSIFLKDQNKDVLSKFPDNEVGLMRLIVECIGFSISTKEKMRWIITPMHNNNRPTTADCIKQWLQSKPSHGSVLAISNQPYCLYQHAVLKTFLPVYFTIETIGCSIQQNEEFGIFLDTLARTLFQEYKRLTQRKRYEKFIS